MIRRFLISASIFFAIFCLSGPEKAFASSTTPPSSGISYPSGGQTLHGQATTVTGTARDYSGSGLGKVEVSINGSAWTTVAGTASWSFPFVLPADGVYTIRTRATDNLQNVETPGAGIAVVVDNCGTPELQHYNWDSGTQAQGCNLCHSSASKFMPSSYDKLVGFCSTCHNPSGSGHDRLAAGNQHPVMVNVSTNWTKRPTYGSITASVNDNRPYARLKDGRLIICTTCHNTMNKYEDFGRAWEFTTSTDSKTYYLDKGGWSFMGNLKPKVYRSSSLWNGPTYSEDRKSYLVDLSEYTYNETAGTVTFALAQAATTYIYVTLDYPYLRVSSRDNALCVDCHSEATHKGVNCLVCHQSHNTSNISGIRQIIRTTDLSERIVNFRNVTGRGSFADGNTVYDGVCEVCHTTTKYYRRDGSVSPIHADGKNYTGKDCTRCHNHLNGFSTSPLAQPPIVVSYLIPSTASAAAGATVSWTVTATGGTGSYQYQFLRSGPDTAGAFVLAQNWGASGSWFWQATPAMVGGNTIKVNVKNSNGTGLVSLTAAYTLASSSTTSYYGTGFAADSLNNICLYAGRTVDYRFRAYHTGFVKSLHLFLIRNGSGYSSGTGGNIYIEIRADDNTSSHLPSSAVLSSRTFTNSELTSTPMLWGSGACFPTITLPSAQLQAGQLYHILFKNTDPNASTNYCSLDEIYKKYPTSPMQPTVSDVDLAILINSGSGYSLDRRDTPVFELAYSDGASQGQGYDGDWVATLLPISGSSAAARESFTVSGPDRIVNSVSIYLARRSGSSPLTVRLEKADGTLIEQGIIPASNWVNILPTNPDGLTPYSYAWGTFNFAASHTLVSGQSYNVVFTTTSDTVYELYPLEKGIYSGAGFTKAVFFHDGYAQYNNGSGWTGYRGYTVADYQFYFTGTGSTPTW